MSWDQFWQWLQLMANIQNLQHEASMNVVRNLR